MRYNSTPYEWTFVSTYLSVEESRKQNWENLHREEQHHVYNILSMNWRPTHITHKKLIVR